MFLGIFFKFDNDFYHKFRTTALGAKCSASLVILRKVALEEKLFSRALDGPQFWWRYISDMR